ncbi:hypothetical protein EYF80_048816 [Liparis tanakae]|uniref:Uncharacterized protein n=1 Tax=Liparis tanakae TaxID=230148 RepID=A0A4Z2FJ65_9TELE|nr:hypothetical protein EYF80_048816 [Liparis tanakae]
MAAANTLLLLVVSPSLSEESHVNVALQKHELQQRENTEPRGAAARWTASREERRPGGRRAERSGGPVDAEPQRSESPAVDSGT